VTDVIPTPTGQQKSLAEIEADLDRAKRETAGPVPLIQSSMEPTLELPRGLFANGIWQRQVTVRELTGMDEESLSRSKSLMESYDLVLSLGTVRIGDIEVGSLPLAERQGHLQQLLIGERDQIYIAVVQATYGDTKTTRFRCPSCDEQQDLILTLSEDFKPKPVLDADKTEFTYTTSKGDVIVYRPAIGADQIEALSRKGALMAEQNTIMLSRCIKSVNGHPPVDPMQYARALGMRDRNALMEGLLEHQPMVDLTVTINCIACREEQVLPLGWGDIFRP
jgi:hypothetical protein